MDATSVMYSAMPRLNGTANVNAIVADRIVPKMNCSAPNWFLFGSHFWLVRKLRKPSWRNAGHALLSVVYAMSASTARTMSPAPSASALKTRSAQTPPVFAVVFPFANADGARSVTCSTLRRWNLQLTQLRFGLLAQRLGKLRIVVRLREALPVGEEVLQERLERVALVLVGLVLVGDDPRRRRDRVGLGAGLVERAVREVGGDLGRGDCRGAPASVGATNLPSAFMIDAVFSLAAVASAKST